MLVLDDGFGTCELSALFAFSPSPLRKAESVGSTGLLKVRGALAAALLLAVIMLMLAAASADAAFPGQDGKIAFNRDNFRQGTSGIFTVAPEGGSQERIGPEYGYSPSWSADGRKLVFVGFSGESEGEFASDIYVMNADGSGVERVTTGRAYEESPSFFPDGQRIAFARYTRDSADIYTKTLGVPGATRITENRGFEESVAVSPNGTKIAFSKFSRNAFGSDLYVMNADGSGTENLTRSDQVDEFGPDWSPDGAKIAFTSARYSGLEGRASQEGEAFAPEALGPGSLGSPARVASGKSTAAPPPEEHIEISVINADGSGREDLTASRAYDVLPAFSPSGDEIVFSRVTFDRRTERSELFVMDSDGANKTQITDTPRAFEYGSDWQPVLLETP
jgi:Tol biopolymer transport system component